MAISLASVQRGLQISKAVVGFEEVSMDNMDEYQSAAEMAAEEIAPAARKFLLENLLGSGLHESTGTLRKQVARAEVLARVKSKSISIFVQMPRDPEGHDGQTATEFFRMCGALNYGAVRFPRSQMKGRDVIDPVTGNITGYRLMSPLGAAAKRTLKKYAMTGKLSKSSRTKIENDYYSKKGGIKIREGYSIGTVGWQKYSTKAKTAGEISSVGLSGGATVIQGRKFFYLKPSQEQRLAGAFIAALGRHMNKDFRP